MELRCCDSRAADFVCLLCNVGWEEGGWAVVNFEIHKNEGFRESEEACLLSSLKSMYWSRVLVGNCSHPLEELNVWL